ncbi:MAG TPA: VOC family protein [Balneolaceae bacterium]|nr:VOC family protein [Balneolaceae bacterium]
MEKVTLDAYLFFNGNCRDAMEFYQQVFGGELEVKTYGEVDDSSSKAMKDRVMHANLTGGEVNLMASDGMDSDEIGTGKISLALRGSDEKKLSKIFDDLSASGKVGHPLEKQFWGDIYGDFTDKFDVCWMVSISNNA